jgi:hypothetical protein
MFNTFSALGLEFAKEGATVILQSTSAAAEGNVEAATANKAPAPVAAG